MEYRVGQELRFKKDIAINLWVDSIQPAGQMGLKKTHLKIYINDFALSVPIDMVSELFTTDIIEEEIKDIEIAARSAIEELEITSEKKIENKLDEEIEKLSKKIAKKVSSPKFKNKRVGKKDA